MEQTDEHLLGTLSGIRSSRTIYRLPKSHCSAKTPWIALWELLQTPCQTVWPGIHRSGDSTSRRDGLTRTVSLLVFLAVKHARRDSTQSRRRSSTNRFRHRQSQLRWRWSNHMNSRRPVGPRVLLHRRRPVRRRYRCQVPVLMKCGGGSLSVGRG